MLFVAAAGNSSSNNDLAPNYPASAAVQVAGLVVPGAMIEIEAIAVLG